MLWKLKIKMTSMEDDLKTEKQEYFENPLVE